MECDILDTLEQLGYSGPLMDEPVLVKASECGFTSPEYVNLCLWLTSRLKLLSGLEHYTSVDAKGSDGLQFEISRLLKEMFCPYAALVSENLQETLQNKENCLKLILYLSSELQAAYIVQRKQLQDNEQESSATSNLKAICRTLKLPEPKTCLAAEWFSIIGSKINCVLKDLPKEHIGKPVLKCSPNGDQWQRLEQINSVLSVEYECRRRMLIKRLDVTVQSFSWSERAKEQIDSMAKAYQPKRYLLMYKSSISLAHLLAAREDICNVEKTSSGLSREKTACAINKILMGSVPDRGGRPEEIEMPSWQKRQDGGGGGRGGGGWGGRGRGKHYRFK